MMVLTLARYLSDSAQEMAGIYPDRVITIEGTVDNMSRAEAEISTILRECIDKESTQVGALVCLFVIL